jgi:3D (Asp-Asp-Asp) domain-containing protein
LATPAAILSVLVQAEGIAETNRKLRNIQDSSEQASKSTEKLEGRFSRLDSTVGDFNRSFTATGNVMRLVKFPALIAGAGMAAQAIGALGAGAVGLVGALGPLVGLAGAGAAGLTALAQAGGVAALAFMGIKDALKEQLTNHAAVAKAATSSAAQQESAAKAIRAAHEGVRSAMQQVTAAQKTLTDAQYQEKLAAVAVADAHKAQKDALAALAPAQQAATRAIQDAQSALAHAYLDEKSAVFGLIDAQNQLNALLKPADALTVADAQDQVSDSLRQQTQATLNLKNAQAQYNAIINSSTATDVQKAQAALDLANAQNAIGDAARGAQHAQENLAKVLSPPDALAVAKAQEAVAQAQQGVRDASRARARQEVDTNAVVKAGVNGSTQVIAAQKAIADANDNAVKAQHALVDAHRATIDAGRGVKDAMHGVQVALQAVKDAQDSAKTSAAGLAAGAVNLNAKFDALPPAAKALVTQLVSLKPKFDDLRSVAAQGLLPGVSKAITLATGNFGPLRTVVDVTAKAMGALAVKAGQLVGSKGFGRDLESVGKRNATIITDVGTGALSLANAFRYVVVAAGPLTSWLGKLAAEAGAYIEAQAKAGEQSGKLAAFFERTRAVLTQLGGIVRDFGIGLFHVFQGGAKLGNSLLDSLQQLAARFRAWTESVSGKNQIATYFLNAKAPLMETFGLIGDIAGALLRISTGKGATPLIAQLRTLVPIFEQVVTNTTAAFGPALIDALGNLLRLFGQIAGSNGPLIQMVKLIGLLAGGLADLLGSTPALRSMTTSFIGLYGAAKALAFVFGPLVAGAKLFEAALIGQATAATVAKSATLGERAALVVTAVAMYAARAATIAMTVATVALDTALAVLTSPITLVIAALALLAAGIIYAYRHSETFRKIVNTMWATLKVVAAWMITAGVAAFNAVATAAKVAWGIVKSVTTTVWGGIRTFLTGLWDGLRTSAAAVFGAIRTVVSVEFGAIKTIASTVWGAVRAAILTPIREARDALGGKDGIWAQIRGTAEAAWGKIKDGVGNFATGVKNAVVDAFQGAANKVIDFVNAIIDVVNLIPGVPNIKHVSHLGGKGTSGKGSGGPNGNGKLAKGGMVPGSGYGDKVPLHIAGKLAAMVEPGELVSVANRNATAALMGVNSAIPRFATGGVFDSTSYGPPWTGINGTGTTATGVNLKGSPHMFGVAVDPNVIGLGSSLDIWPNPFNTHSKFKAFDTGSAIKGRHLDFYDWRGRSAQYGWGSRQVRVGGGAIGPGIGDILGNLNPLDLIGKLPGVGGLPDWLKGTGKYVLSHVGKWIKDNVVKAVTGGGGPISSGPNGVGTFEGVPMANWVIGSLKYGRKHGAFGNPTSGYRPGFDPHTATGSSEHQGTRYPHGAVDFGGYHDARALAEKLSYVHATAGYKYPLLAPKGFVDDGHASGTGHMRGGVLPFLGSYHNGGIARREGLAHVAAGERMTPAGRGGPLVNIEHAEFKQGIDVNSFAAHIGFKIATA